MSQALEKTRTIATATVTDPFFSVVIAVHREPVDIFKRSLESILQQTFDNLEAIVVVDNPGNRAVIDYLREVARTENRLTACINRQNFGVAYSVNFGIGQSRGRYVARQDADDESRRERLARQYDAICKDPSIDVLGTGLSYIDATTGQVLLRRFHKEISGQERNRRCPRAV